MCIKYILKILVLYIVILIISLYNWPINSLGLLPIHIQIMCYGFVYELGKLID